MVRWPGVVEPGSERDEIVSNLDFAETFLDIAGVKVPEDMQGRSFKTMLVRKRRPAGLAEDVLLSLPMNSPAPTASPGHYGVADGRYKLIHYYRRGEWELFDLKQDPHELNSVHGEEDYAEVRKELEAELKRLREHYKDDGKVRGQEVGSAPFAQTRRCEVPACSAILRQRAGQAERQATC